LEGKWGVRAYQTEEMKGKEGSGDPEGQEGKSGLALSGSGLARSEEKCFFADVVVYLRWGTSHKKDHVATFILLRHRPHRKWKINIQPHLQHTMSQRVTKQGRFHRANTS